MSKYSSKGRGWDGIRRIVLTRAGNVCEEQGCNQQATHVDHIYPKALGGTDDLDNLQAMCQMHNLRKGARVVKRATYFSPEWFTSSDIHAIGGKSS